VGRRAGSAVECGEVAVKIIWRDDVRMESTKDAEGTRYLIPVAPGSPMPAAIRRRIQHHEATEYLIDAWRRVGEMLNRAELLGRQSRKRKGPRSKLTKTERKKRVIQALDGYPERQAARLAARKLAGVRARTKFNANPFPVDTVAARQFAETQ
jgi:hypothetical protein